MGKRRYMAFPDDESADNQTPSLSSMNISGLCYENLQPQMTDIFASKMSDCEGTQTNDKNNNAETMMGYADSLCFGHSEGNMIGIMNANKNEDDNEGCETLMGSVQTMNIDMSKMKVTMMGFEHELSDKIAFKEQKGMTLMGMGNGKISF